LGIHISYGGGITTVHANEFLGENIIHVGNFKPFGDIFKKKTQGGMQLDHFVLNI
jgi:hypothetical protein